MKIIELIINSAGRNESLWRINGELGRADNNCVSYVYHDPDSPRREFRRTESENIGERWIQVK